MKNKVIIIATGSEITNGKSMDTNSAWIANELSGQGFDIRQFIALPDKPELIKNNLAMIRDNHSADWIIMTGGLGPTVDDYTVDVVLDLTGDQELYVEKAKLKLEAVYRKRGKTYTDILPTVFRQTRVPENSRILENKVGIAPGFISELNSGVRLACMPGVPPEMIEMFNRRLLPIMLKETGIWTRFRGERLIWNIGESLFQEEFVKNHSLLQENSPHPVEWGVTAKRGYIKATFLSEDQATIDTIMRDLDNNYSDRVSNDCFADLHNQLVASGKKIAIAESCTGGWLGKILTDRPGSSSYFVASLVTYHNQAKENLLFVSNETLRTEGAVSELTAKEMLSGLEKHFDVDYSVSITGIAGPQGGSEEKPVGLVFVGIKKKGQPARIIQYRFPGNRETIREATANNAIFQLYKEISS